MVGAGMFSPARAQMIPDNAVFYHAIRSPWSNSYNPALFPKNSSWYVTTAKTSLQLSIPLSYNDLGLQIDPVRNVTVLNVNDVLDRLRSTGCNFYNNSDLNLFGFGFTLLEHVHVSASAGVKSLSSFNIPLGLIDFLTQGNLNETGHIDFGEKDIFSNQNFAYVSLGAAVKLPFIPLTLGARVNVLDGIAALSVDNLSLDLTTAEDVSSIRLTSDYMIHSAGGFKFKRTEGGSFAFDMEHLKDFVPLNIGFTVDLGAKYNVGVFDFSVSLLDVGPGIKWKQSPTVYFPKQKDVSISFEGIDLSTLVTNGTVDTSFIGRLKDSLLAMIDYSQGRASTGTPSPPVSMPACRPRWGSSSGWVTSYKDSSTTAFLTATTPRRATMPSTTPSQPTSTSSTGWNFPLPTPSRPTAEELSISNGSTPA